MTIFVLSAVLFLSELKFFCFYNWLVGEPMNALNKAPTQSPFSSFNRVNFGQFYLTHFNFGHCQRLSIQDWSLYINSQ